MHVVPDTSPLLDLVVAVFDGELDAPIPRAGALLREAIDRGYVERSDTGRPVRVTPRGIGWLREHGLVRPGDTAVR